METDRYMLISNNKNIRRYRFLTNAIKYAKNNCRGANEFYIIVDTAENYVVTRWGY